MRVFWIIIFLSLSSWALSQERCPTDMHRLDRMDHFENWLKKRVEKVSGERSGNTIYQVPVVVHVIHEGEPVGTGTNLSDEKIIEQISLLNNDFRRTNHDVASTPAQFLPVAADTEIEFVLARQDPEGFPTDGIVRVLGSSNFYTFATRSAIYSESYWPSEDYLNIWVVNLDDGVLGFASFPESDLEGIDSPGVDPTSDGVVVTTSYFGVNFNDEPGFDSFGRTLTHEVGHFLGLRHIWGDGGASSCGVDDFCGDTPNADTNNGGIGAPCTFPNPLDGQLCATGEPEMFQNYMDYTNDECMNLFTLCQKGRMRTVLENSPRRLSLLTSPGLTEPILFDRDVAVSLLEFPLLACAFPDSVTLFIQNRGNDTVTGLALILRQDDQQISNIVNLNLQTRDTLTLNLPNPFTGSPGLNELEVQVTTVNGQPDQNPGDNASVQMMEINSNEAILPYRATFEVDPSLWSTTSPDMDNGEWQLDQFGNNTYFAIPAANLTTGITSHLVSPIIDASSYPALGMFFELSSTRIFGENARLEVWVSGDCGGTYERINSYALNELQVFPIGSAPLNVPDEFASFFIDLTPFQSDGLRVAFRYYNLGGNNLFLDNIDFVNNSDPDQPRLASSQFSVYPNPTLGSPNITLTLNLPGTQDLEVQLTDINGGVIIRKKIPNRLNQTFDLSVAGLSGMYFIELIGPDIRQQQRIVIGR